VRRAPTAAPQAAARAAQIPFRDDFPFWQLSIAPGDSALATHAAGRDALVFAGSTALILVALVAGVVLLIRDVSRDQQLNRLRTDLVSGVSHELKTPLTLIRLYAETLSEDREVPDGERRRYYEIITRASERLTHLVEKVLDFSRIERGRTTYDLTEGDIGPVVARTVEIYGQHLRRRGFTITATLAREMPQIRFDAEAVAGAVLNLLENAAKYSGDSRSIEARLFTNEEHVIVEVEDHGVGIAAEEQGLVFEQFYRSGRKGSTGGYGLGLYLVRHVMEEHAGHIELDSEPGRGARFRLVFPVANVLTQDRSAAQGPRVT
jgi:two-component system phosphate regulon sensor histidine kinase PhoR